MPKKTAEPRKNKPTKKKSSAQRKPGRKKKQSKLKNTESWGIASVTNGGEAFANWRRSGFPILQPNKYNNNLNGGFVRRMAYPNAEEAQNPDNYKAAVASMGGDGLTQRILWDKP